MTFHATALHSNLTDRLNQTFDMYTTDKEKIEMSESSVTALASIDKKGQVDQDGDDKDK